MKVLIQRVNHASVEVDSQIVGKIDKGLVLFVGISKDFTEEKLDYMVKKIPKLRLFNSQNKGFDLSIKDVEGEILIVSQFTLHGKIDANKPNFINSAEYEKAKEIYNRFIEKIKQESKLKVESGIFGAMMKVNLENDGPVTIIIDR